MHDFKYLGFGLGLRPSHYEVILQSVPRIDWFEIITEDYLVPGGESHYYLEKIRERYPIVMHGLSMSVGGCDPLNWDYLKQLKILAERIQPAWISDHLCWTGINGVVLHDLLPIPYTEESLAHVAERIDQIQDYLGQPILLENPSTYVTFKQDHITEWDFLNALVEKTGCKLLLDINNVYVSSFNHGFDPLEYLASVTPEAVQQFHLAGHKNCGAHIIDTHDEAIIDNVWMLYEKALERFSNVSVLIERDGNIPPLEELVRELDSARGIAASAGKAVA